MVRVARRQHVGEPSKTLARGMRVAPTAVERLLWRHLRGGQLGGHHFRRQQPIGPYIADFYCAAGKVVVEVDGAVHEQQAEYDRERDAYLADHGLRVLRFANDDVLHALDHVVMVIRDALAEAGCDGEEGRL